MVKVKSQATTINGTPAKIESLHIYPCGYYMNVLIEGKEAPEMILIDKGLFIEYSRRVI